MAKIVSIADIENGMIVAEPVINKFGQTLAPAGATLTEKHKTILRTWNIQSVVIKSDDQEEEVEISEELRSMAIEKLNTKMLWEPRNAIENNLFKIGINQMALSILHKDKD